MHRFLLSALLVAAPLAASAQIHFDSPVPPAGPKDTSGPVVPSAGPKQTGGPIAGFSGSNDVRRCGITDLAPFNAYIATRPTPVEFRARYSCLTLVLPGDMSTRELRMDNSRYFADLDAHGRIQGGAFR
ncbi:MAG: hypothetical protein GAK28_03598 [Luteibacter sp.]|uniref:hypothetical protein n=1 Tax=Luteibacter sp. TaxID=1886636 RepID=UPI00138452E0|nr:hypothetical protein [Luteibacter sp.]KAF1004971.1 MAG: hypothetical protein GAK28_03598 [Luteibacter sp.]